jgi:Uma2 family endonuclease
MSDTTRRIYRAADLAKLPTGVGKRYELIEGKIIAMAATKLQHGIVTNKVSLLLNLHNMVHKLGTILGAETGFYTRGDDLTVRAPDVAFISYKRLTSEKLAEAGEDFGKIAPDLVIEVVSPGERRGKIIQKVQEWLDFGVSIVWVVYPKKRQVHVYLLNQEPQILTENDALSGGEILSGFETLVRAFFED